MCVATIKKIFSTPPLSPFQRLQNFFSEDHDIQGGIDRFRFDLHADRSLAWRIFF